MKIYTDSYDLNKVYKTKEGYHYNGSRYKSLSEVKEAYRQMNAVKAFFTVLSIVVLITCIACAGFLILSAINVF